jgi:eukaryotic-like serine/threonine-protein kinase
MTPERWQIVVETFEAAAERPQHERAPFLDAACAGDADLRREVESLLLHDSRSENFLDAPQFTLIPETVAGMVVGAYRVLRELGAGGMGAVYLGVRADDHYRKEVAIKVLQSSAAQREIVQRFRGERQILASLDHPYIARLVDGGVLGDGRPYFVMDYVEGEPIDRYCIERALPFRQRVEIFRKVCEAVQAAHRALVVHRDLKPRNIFVQADGTPKLLDFGIAKVLGSDGADDTGRTETGMRFMTPDYASPEQVRGEPITTASDVYSLGVVLYELLAGRRPYRLVARTAAEMERAICEEEPAPLATTRERIDADLEAIVLKALQKEPARRYGSVEQLSEDLRRYLTGLPVGARRNTAAYRAYKFVRRYRVPVATAALLFLSLAGGFAATVWQASVARTERDRAEAQAAEARAQRQRAETSAQTSAAERQRAETERARASDAATVAEAQRTRAEKRLQDIRQLVGSFLFEFQDSIQDLPGAMAAREMVVKRALEYLDRLAREDEPDADLRSELALAYFRVADIQGNPFRASLGQSAAALESYQKGLALRESILREKPGDGPTLGAIGTVENRISQVLARMGDTAGALAHQRRAEQVWAERAAREPGNLAAQRELTVAHQVLGDLVLRTGDNVAAMREYRTMQQNALKLLAREPSSREFRRDLSYSYHKIGDLLYLRLANYDAALAEYQQMFALRAQLAREEPNNTNFARDLLMSHDRMGMVLTQKREYPAALDHQRRMERLARELLQADPKNVVVKRDLFISQFNIADIESSTGAEAAALQTMRGARAIAQELLDVNPKSAQYRTDLSEVDRRIGEMLGKAGDTTGALASFESSRTLLESLASQDNQNVEIKEGLAALYQQIAQLSAGSAGSRETSCARFRQAHDLYVSLGDRASAKSSGALDDIRKHIASCEPAAGPR